MLIKPIAVKVIVKHLKNVDLKTVYRTNQSEINRRLRDNYSATEKSLGFVMWSKEPLVAKSAGLATKS